MSTFFRDELIKSNEPKMARYSMAEPISGEQSPVHWDKEEFNLGIIYNNGVITIDQPGFYRITAACYFDDNRDRYIGLQTLVNGVPFIRTWSSFASPGFSQGIKHLSMFDTIFFKKFTSERMKYGIEMNYFMIEKVWKLFSIFLKTSVQK